MNSEVDIKNWELFEIEVAEESCFADNLIEFLKKTIVGQENMLQSLLIGLLGNGHVLLEGFPGLAKTLAVKTLARAINARFSRIQFTPDILPADILGTMIYNVHTNEFNVKQGPIFSNFILADEINRAPEKVQSALLEVMQEHQVTIGNNTYPVTAPFMVLATQNPIDQSGTYELPEAQMDRFMLKITISYPSIEEERYIMQKHIEEGGIAEPSFNVAHIFRMQSLVKKVYIDAKIEDYILNIIFCTRYPENYGLNKLKPLIRFGSSPRGTINLAMAARARAFLKKRAFVIPEDVASVIFEVLRHRIGLTYNALAENVTSDNIIGQILRAVPAP
jgi:MoxR-like ATPase